jgi:DNA-binding NtrC family response regulator
MEAKRGDRVLVLDDEPTIRVVIADYLRMRGFEVETAGNVREALALLARPFDLVLSDVRMPGGDGIDFLRAARRTNPDLGVFLMTGYPEISTVIEAKRYGAAAYFRKPLRLAELASRIEAYLAEPRPAD